MPDKLRALVEQRDRANARPHRLTGKPVLPERGEQRMRRVCILCRKPVNDRAIHYASAPDADPDCRLSGGRCKSVRGCPSCGGTLVEVSG